MGLSFVVGFRCGLQIGHQDIKKQEINNDYPKAKVGGDEKREKEFVAPA
jgi:hypothetical protein